MNSVEAGLSRRVHFVVGLAVLFTGYAGAILAVKFLIIGE